MSRESAENALPCLADLFAPRSRDHIPTPPRATTKLFDATCVPTAPVTWRNAGAVRCVPLYAGHIAIAKFVVNLTLTSQRRAHESGTEVSPKGRRRGKAYQ